jgi:hypothetical protein
MKKLVSIAIAAVAALVTVSCVQEQLVTYDDSKATAPVINSYDVTDDGLVVSFTPGSFNQNFNQKMPVNHMLILLTANGNTVNKVLATAKDDVISVSTSSLSRTLIGMGYQEGDVVSMTMALRATMQEPARDNGRNGFLEAAGTISVNDFVVVVPKGSPYQEYTELSTWSVIGAIAAYEMNWDKDLVMWTDGTNHVAAHVTLSAGDEFKFRQDAAWTVNMGGDFGSLDNEFAVTQDGPNIKVNADGVYDLFVNPSAGTAWISAAFDPYPEYTETSNWSVIGALSAYEINWDGDIAMITDGTNHLALGVTLGASDEFKFRQDAAWTVNLGGEFGGLDNEFAVTQDGANIIVGADGVYDLFVNPGAGTAKVANASGAKVSYIAGSDEPEPEPEPVTVTGWNIIGLNGDWDNDVLASRNGNVWTAYITATDATEFKWRKDGAWEENYGGNMADFGVPFAAETGGSNIAIPAGFYKVVLDLDNTTITVYNDFVVWSLIGDFNSWAGDVDMVEVDGKWVAEDVNLTPGWKLRKNHDWTDNRGGVFVALGEPFAVTAGGDNIDCGTGKFTVTYNPADETVTISEGTVWSLIGNFNSWAGDVDMELKDGKWVAEGVDLTPGWKIRKNHDWPENRGGVFVEFGEPFAVTNGGADIDCGTGKFNVSYSPADETITVTPATYGWSLIGVNGDWNTDIDMMEVMPGIWMSPVTEITSEGWKIRYNHDWEVNRGSKELTAEGMFVKGVQGGDNISLTGKFKVVYNANNGTIGTLVWGVVGSVASIEGFSWNNDVPMNLGSDGKWYSIPVTLAAGDEIKIRKYADWTENFGGDFAEPEVAFEAVAGGNNIKNAEGTFMVVYDPTAGTLTLSKLYWGIVGEFSGWGGQPDVFMLPVGDGKWAAYNQSITGPWKVRQSSNWDVNRGGAFTAKGTAFEAVPGGDNITVAEEGAFDVIYDSAAETILVQ